MRRVGAWLLFLPPAMALAPATALAHASAAHAGDGIPWTLDAWVLLPLLLALAWFNAGWLRLRPRFAQPRRHRRQFLLFHAGWLVMAGALVSPLHAAGERSFTLHMLEHELLMLVAAPLLVLARPLGVALWAFPREWRTALGRLQQRRWFRGCWALASDPVATTALQILVLWAWHAPVLFDLALAYNGWHIAQHVSFVASALLFWNAMLARHRPGHAGVAVACLFATAIVGGALGALMALSTSPWYEGYRAMGMAPFGLSPAEDQQLAGLLMWVPGGLVHVLAALLVMARGLREQPSTATAPGADAGRPSTDAGATLTLDGRHSERPSR